MKLRAVTRLAVDATERVTGVVEAMHRTIASGPAVLGQPLALPARVFTGVVYGGVRAATRLVGAGLDLALARLEPALGETAPGPEREALVAAINGVVGDYLAERNNPLAIEMSIRHDGRALDPARDDLAALGERWLVLIHGSSMCAGQWNRGGHDHGAALAAELGFTPLYVQYNSGLHVSKNGHQLAALLEDLCAHRATPPAEVVLVGHSMGGLVARSACHAAERAGHAWRRRVTRLVSLGTPHHGAPLERAGSVIDRLLLVSQYSAPLATLAKLRSAGVTDLRYGNVVDEHWHGRDRFAFGDDTRCPVPLPAGVACYAIAGTTAREPGDRLPGDGLVPLASALGRHARSELELAFPEDHRFVAHGTGHMELLGNTDVYRQLATWLR
jgi:pimeloyl-ACP methyl ester carboxylesterase